MEKVLVQETGCSWRLAREALLEAKKSFPADSSPFDDVLLTKAREIITPKLEEDKEQQKMRRRSSGSRSGSDTEDENRRPSVKKSNSKAKMKPQGAGSSKNLQKRPSVTKAQGSSKKVQKRPSTPEVVSDAEHAEKEGLCPTCGVKTHNVSRFNKEPRKNKDVHYGVFIRCNPKDVPPSARKAWEERQKTNPTSPPNAQKNAEKDSASPPEKQTPAAAGSSPKLGDKVPATGSSRKVGAPATGGSSRKVGEKAPKGSSRGVAAGAAAASPNSSRKLSSSPSQKMNDSPSGRTSHCDTCGIRTHRGNKTLSVELKNENVHYGVCIRCNPQDVPPSVRKAWQENQELKGSSVGEDDDKKKAMAKTPSKAHVAEKASSPSSSTDLSASKRDSQRVSKTRSGVKSEASDSEMSTPSSPMKSSSSAKNFELMPVKETGCSWRLAHDALDEARESSKEEMDDDKVIARAREIITPQFEEDKEKHKASRRPSGSRTDSDNEGPSSDKMKDPSGYRATKMKSERGVERSSVKNVVKYTFQKLSQRDLPTDDEGQLSGAVSASSAGKRRSSTTKSRSVRSYDVSDSEGQMSEGGTRRASPSGGKNLERILVQETGCTWRLAHDALGKAKESSKENPDGDKLIAEAKAIIDPQLATETEEKVKRSSKSNRALKPVKKSPSPTKVDSPQKPPRTQIYSDLSEDEDVSDMLAAATIGGAAGAAGGAAAARKKQSKAVATSAAPSTSTKAQQPKKKIPDKKKEVSPAVAAGTAAAIGAAAAAAAASDSDAATPSPAKVGRGVYTDATPVTPVAFSPGSELSSPLSPDTPVATSPEGEVSVTDSPGSPVIPVTPEATSPSGQASSPARSDDAGFLSRTFEIPADVSHWLEESFSRDDISVVVLAAASGKSISHFMKEKKKKSSRSKHRRSSTHRRKSTGPPPEEVAALRSELQSMKSEMQAVMSNLSSRGAQTASEAESD